MPGDERALFTLLARRPLRRLWVGYSGGRDSHALLHWLAGRRAALAERGLTLAAAHVDHGLHLAAAAWREHAERTCAALGVPLRCLRVDARAAPGDSPEAAARAARYRALAGLLDTHAALLTAHHRDDQAETLLLALLRGAGPAGLAAMPELARLAPGWLLRPWLAVDRDAIAGYARAHGLRWIDDDSNDDVRFDRNYLRRHVIPSLRRRWPAAAVTLARSAALCADADALLAELADADLRTAEQQAGNRAPVTAERSGAIAALALGGFAALSPPRQRNLLRRWLARATPRRPPPSRAQLEALRREVALAGRDRRPLLRLPGLELRRYRGALYALSPQTPPPRGPVPWPDWRAPCPLDGCGTLRFVAGRDDDGLALREDALRALEVRFRRGGERLERAGTLKKLLHARGVAPWLRDRVPLLYADGAPIAVAGLWRAPSAAPARHARGWRLEWQNAPQSVNV